MNLAKDPESWARIHPDTLENPKVVLTLAIQDIGKMADEIERLRNAVDRLVLQVERTPAEAKAIEADIARRKALGEL